MPTRWWRPTAWSILPEPSSRSPSIPATSPASSAKRWTQSPPYPHAPSLPRSWGGRSWGVPGGGCRRPLKPPRLARHLDRAPPPAPHPPKRGSLAALLRRDDSRGGGALLFGARYGSSDSLPTAPAARHPPAPPSRCVHDLATWQLASSFGGTSPSGGGWGRGHPPWTRIFCALPKRRTRFSWPVTSGLCGLRVSVVRGDPVV